MMGADIADIDDVTHQWHEDSFGKAKRLRNPIAQGTFGKVRVPTGKLAKGLRWCRFSGQDAKLIPT
jgi:hypothetical protein